MAVPPVIAKVTESAPIVQTSPNQPGDRGLALQLVQQAKTLHEAGQLDEASQSWQQAASMFAALGDQLNQAMALSNLSATFQQLGEWDKANQTITQSLNLLATQPSTPEQLRILAQTKDIFGQLQLAEGQSEDAIDTWQQAADIYAQIGHKLGITQSRINQAQAMQNLGLYPRACKTLLEALELDNQNCQISAESLQTLKNQLASPTKVLGINALGNVLRVVGSSEQSKTLLEEGLNVAKQLNSPEDIAAIYLSLGNTVRAIANTKVSDSAKQAEYRQAGLNYYNEAAKLTPSPTTRILAQLNQLSLLLESTNKSCSACEGEIEVWQQAQKLVRLLKPQLNNLPADRTGAYAQINYARSLMKLLEFSGSPLNSSLKSGIKGEQQPTDSEQIPTFQEIDQLLATAAESAHHLGDKRTEAYASGIRGKLYENSQQWEQAEHFIQQALSLAPTFKAPDIAYQFFWQLGRIRKVQGDTEKAIANYTQAVNTLQSLRSDLVSISSDVQFSFRESVEPVYRELVGLLLQPSSEKASQKSLVQAREVIESLQLAELDNFFHDACVDTKSAQIDQIDKTAAIFYPIILSDRLEVIVALPGQPLRQYTTFLPKEKIDQTLKNLVDAVTIPRLHLYLKRFLDPSQQVYNWLIRPVEAELAASGIKTLTFVPDGALRNVPFSALHDGQQYLVQKYSVAIAPGLQLVDPKPIAEHQLQILAFGLSESRQGFPALPHVQSELNYLKTGIESQVELNEAFTNSNFQHAIKSSSFAVIHLATHGQFSSSAQDTFVLTWDSQIGANDFTELLRSQQENEKHTIELLVLSACQTAEGDDRAALGLAGVAVRAGARSTLASLWYVNDEATSLLMTQFYQDLTTRQKTKAEALRHAQEAILQNHKFSHPYYWSGFVLVGNWL